MKRDVDTVIEQLAPMTDAEVAGLVEDRDVLARAIMATEPPGPARSHRRRPVAARRLVALGAAASVGAVALLAVQADRDDAQVWAAGVVEVAEGAPRLLIDDPDWRIDDVDQFDAEFGSMSFTDGTATLYVEWDTIWDFDDRLARLSSNAGSETAAVVAGHDAVTFGFQGGGFSTLWQQRGHSVAVDTSGPMDQAAFDAVLGALHEVDVDTWLTAMPADVVRPDDGETVLAELLADVPLPDGFHVEPLTGAGSRFQLVRDVAGSATCAWVEEWIRATGVGDAKAADEAAAALDGSSDWAIVQEIDDGDHSSVWYPREEIDSLVDDGVLAGGHEIVIVGDTPMEAWRNAYACR